MSKENLLIVKEVEDDFTVTVQNENVDGGYIFQDTEDWSGGPGVRIQKLVPLPYTPISQFGQGSISTTGTGTVEDAVVLYMYRWDECFNPQNNENCPGYVPPMPVMPVIEIYDVLEDEIVDDATKETDKELIEEKKEGHIENGKGPVIAYAPAVQQKLRDLITETAEEKNIPFQRSALSRATGTDTDAFAYSNGGVPSVLISLPLKYMHTTCETVHKDDVENVIKLIYNTLLNIEENHNFKYNA